MTDGADPSPGARPDERPSWTMVTWSAVRALGSTAALVALYYALPLSQSAAWVAVAMLVAGLVLLVALVTLQVRLIVAARFPGLRAVEALATSVPLFLLMFASTYVVLTAISAGNFSQPLNRTNALYFAVTVFATVGFGDITAKTDTAQLLVTVQMLLDLVILGLGARIILGAVTRGRQRRARAAPPRR